MLEIGDHLVIAEGNCSGEARRNVGIGSFGGGRRLHRCQRLH